MKFVNNKGNLDPSFDPHEESFEILLNRYLPKEFRDFIEGEFYQKVTQQSQLEVIKNNEEFLKDPVRHIALYSDHGVVHVRDVAMRILEVIDRTNGLLIPERNSDDLEFLKGYGLMLAYLHDIGMSSFSNDGRFMHPEFAAQYVFSEKFDSMIELLWSKNAGNIPWIVSKIFKLTCDEHHLKTIFREILALSLGHSKSKIPIGLLNNVDLLRPYLVEVLSTPLDLLIFDQKIKKIQRSNKKNKEEKINALKIEKEKWLSENKEIPPNNSFYRFYKDPKSVAFSWLNEGNEEAKIFVLDILDTIRCLRSADALRQRGTVLRTSAGYEIFSDRKTANAIYALRSDDGKELYLLESKKVINAGEANIASSEIDTFGNLHISFHIGSFDTQEVTNKAAENATVVIDDIQVDTIESFNRAGLSFSELMTKPKIDYTDIKILVEDTEDNPNFSQLVCESFRKLNPKDAFRIERTFSSQGLDKKEVDRYIYGEMIDEFFERSELDYNVLSKLSNDNNSIMDKDSIPGKEYLKVIHLEAGEVLIKSGSKSGFVYYPMTEGLRIHPMGGYKSTQAVPWLPLGNTGVIRSNIRNADIVSEKPVSLICIPKNTYLEHWYQPILPKNFKKMLQ